MAQNNQVLLNCMKIFAGGYLLHIFIALSPTAFNRISGGMVVWTSANSTGWTQATNTTYSNTIYAATGGDFFPLALILILIALLLLIIGLAYGRHSK